MAKIELEKASVERLSRLCASNREMAQRLNVHEQSIHRLCQRLGVKTPGQRKKEARQAKPQKVDPKTQTHLLQFQPKRLSPEEYHRAKARESIIQPPTHSKKLSYREELARICT